MNIEKKYYPDRSFYPIVHKFEENIVFRINTYDDLWYLKQIKDIYDYNKVNLNITIPNLLDSQADRRFNFNESHNLKLICNFINELKFESVSIFHPHNPEIVEALINNVEIINNVGFVYDVLDYIEEKTDVDFSNDGVLLSTDAGGFKPLMKLCDKIEWKGDVYSASKSRVFENNESKLIQQLDKEDFENKNILIIDDLCVYGGTFIGLAKILKTRNVGKIYLAVSHITVNNPNPDLNVFDKIFTTNSKYNEYQNLNNLKIFNHFITNEDRSILRS